MTGLSFVHKEPWKTEIWIVTIQDNKGAGWAGLGLVVFSNET